MVATPAVGSVDGILYERTTLLPVTARSADQLHIAREHAIEVWRNTQPASEPPLGAGREQLMDHHRGLAAHWLEGTIIEERLRALGASHVHEPPTVVVAHRHEWQRRQLVSAVTVAGGHVTCSTDLGSDVIAALVVEQPDLLFTTNHLQGHHVPGLLARARTLVPGIACAVQVGVDTDAHHLRGTGVHGVYSRRMRPLDLAQALMRIVTHEPQNVADALGRGRERAADARTKVAPAAAAPIRLGGGRERC